MLTFGAVLHSTFHKQSDRDLCLVRGRACSPIRRRMRALTRGAGAQPWLSDAAELAASLRDSARPRYPQQR